MVGLWFRTLVRKLSGGPLPPRSRTAQRRSACLHVEALEDRTVTSAMANEPTGLVAPAPEASAAIVTSDKTDAASNHPVYASRDIAKIVPHVGPEMERLLEDIRKLKAPYQRAPIQSDLSTFTGSFDGPRSKNDLPSGARDKERDLSRGDIGLPHARAEERSAKAQPAPPTAVHPSPSPVAASTPPAGESARPLPEARISEKAGPTGAQPNQNLGGAEGNVVVPEERHANAKPSATERAEFKRLSADLPDGSLLQRFVVHREQAAFTMLVQRHERTVLGICQRVLGDAHAAQDAFQATFLVLARKAGILDSRSPLAGWLYRVAYRLALRLRAVTARQRRREQAANDRATQEASEVSAVIEKQELLEALGEELQRLPEKYRTPLILCYFEGRTHEEAAQMIGLPRGSMAKRIGEGLELLQMRLLERGFTL
ncbi:MAG: sigma-70 family RNA polymerase sigma factor [Gemmataceae bacterium]|nr:sigma-70 family RNA polymerase sigma factor [Gemmataceae bacterium]